VDVVRTRDLRKVYRAGKVSVPALNGLNLSVGEGEFVAIMGPSGCGKSTLLHLLGGLDRPTSGSIFIDGVDMTALDSGARTQLRKEKIGFVFQRFNLIPGLSASDNIDLASTIKGRPDRPGPDRDELLEVVGLAAKAGRKPSELSFGEQQRVAIARALIHGPRLLLADEPTGNLDSASAERVLNLFVRINRKYDQTLLMITHSEESASYAHRIVYMRDGLLVD
jgi:putative ABC transport system ATP-binding protein